MRSRPYKGEEHFLYRDVEEFRKYYPDEPFVQWEDGQVGEWVQLTDGGICEVLHDGYMQRNGRKTRYIKTVAGMALVYAGFDLDSEFPESIHSLGGREKTSETKRLSAKEFEFFLQVTSYVDPVEAYLDVYSTNNPGYARKRAYQKLRSPRFKQLMDEHFKSELDAKGLTDEYLVTKLFELLEGENFDRISHKEFREALELVLKLKGYYETGKERTIERTREALVFGGALGEKQLSAAEKALKQFGGKHAITKGDDFRREDDESRREVSHTQEEQSDVEGEDRTG